MSDSKQLISVSEEIGATFEAMLRSAQVKGGDEGRIAMSLCLTIAEGFSAVMAVLRSRSESHALVHVRSMQEALADLKNLVSDPSYLDQI